MAVLEGHDIGDDPVAHVLARLQRRRTEVGQEDDVGMAHQARMDGRLMFEYIQAHAGDRPRRHRPRGQPDTDKQPVCCFPCNI